MSHFRRSLLLSTALLTWPISGSTATPNFHSQADGSVKLSAVEIKDVPGILYACLSTYRAPSKLLCFAIQKDGSVLVVKATKKGTSA